MEKKRIAVVANANAGKNTEREGLAVHIAKILTTPDLIFATGSLEELAGASQAVLKAEPDIIAVAGGDGTIHQTLSGIISAYAAADPQKPLPAFLLVPVGTMNNVCTSLDVTRYKAEELAKRVVMKNEHGMPLDTVHWYCLKVNGEYGFIYGSGLPVHFLQEYYKGKPDLGPRGAVRVILRVLWNEMMSKMLFRKSKELLTKPVHAKIVLPERHEPPVAPYMSHTALMVSSVDQVGLGCRAMPQAMTKPGCFMVRSSRLTFWGYAACAFMPPWPIWLGTALPFTFDGVVPQVTIEYEQPTVCTIDGEIKPPTTRDIIECGPLMEFIRG